MRYLKAIVVLLKLAWTIIDVLARSPEIPLEDILLGSCEELDSWRGQHKLEEAELEEEPDAVLH